MGSEVTRGCAVGIDPGERWIGVARAAHGSSLALPIGTLDRRAVENDIADALQSLLGEEHVSELVIGVPVLPDGREDEQATAFREFGEALARTLGATCIPQNERFSSEPLAFEPISNPRGQGRKARAQGRKSAQRQRRDRERSHAAAAARILQRWLDTREHRQARDAAERAT